MVQKEEVMNEMESRGNAGPSNIYQPTIMPSEKADLFDKINPADIVEVFKYHLMGYEYQKDNMIWVKKGSKGMSEQGASEIAALMLSVSSKNVAISNIKDDEIRTLTKATHREAILLCLRNWKEYNREDSKHVGLGPDQIGLISQIVKNNTFITLKQPEHAGIRELIKGTTSEVRSIQQATERKGVLGSMFRK